MSEIKVRKRRTWSAIPDDILQDKTLSLDTRAVLGWMIGRPDGWIIRIGPMLGALGLTKHIWSRIRGELQRAGYLFQARHSDEHGRIAWQIEVTDDPSDPPWSKNSTMDTIGEKFSDGSAADGQARNGQPGDITTSIQHDQLPLLPASSSPPTETQGDVVVTADSIKLHFPPALEGRLRQSAELAISRCPAGLCQAVLDEVDGICRRGRLQGNPIGLLSTLCQRAAAGTFTPSLGLDIASRRAVAASDKGIPPPTKAANRDVTRHALSEMHAIVSRHTVPNAPPCPALSTSNIRTQSPPAGGAPNLSHQSTD